MLTVLYNCSVGSPAVVLVREKLSFQGFKGVKLQSQQPCTVGLKLSTVHQECLC